MTSSTGQKRFWFPVPGHLGIGVTAPTRAEAELHARKVADHLHWDFDPSQAIIGVDIQTLDQKHVVPNMKPPVWPGVWFPMGF